MASTADEDFREWLSPAARRLIDIRDEVISRCEHEMREHIAGAQALDAPILTDALPSFFDRITEALSPGHPRQNATSHTNAAAAHGGERARMTSFDASQIVHEYQIFREAIGALAAGRIEFTHVEWGIIDQSINLAMREAVQGFVEVQDGLRRQLASTLSHDMRTPLGLIVNAAQLIKSCRELAVAQRFAIKVESGGRRLEAMIDDLLWELSAKGRSRMPLNIALINIAELIEQIRSAYAEPQHANIRISAEPVSGHWCGQTLRRALENLINNANAYGDGKGVDIVAREMRGRLLLSVRNGGAPIPKDRQNQLFDYLDGQSAAMFTAGWGIGLPFVKRAAQAHGGSVIVDSSIEAGTVFSIDIPIDARPYVIGIGTQASPHPHD